MSDTNVIPQPLVQSDNERNALIDRAIAIQEEYKSLVKPSLNAHSIEDVDDAYQEVLEFNYYVSDLRCEFDAINAQLGITGKKLVK